MDIIYLSNFIKTFVMKTLILCLLVVFAFTTPLSSCKKKNQQSTSYTPSCSSSTPSFSTSVSPIFQSYCVSCHSNYSAYSQISSSASSIRNSIVNGSMPKGTSLSESQKNSIVWWIDAGKPNN